jgi:hypothetical protein
VAEKLGMEICDKTEDKIANKLWGVLCSRSWELDVKRMSMERCNLNVYLHKLSVL